VVVEVYDDNGFVFFPDFIDEYKRSRNMDPSFVMKGEMKRFEMMGALAYMPDLLANDFE